MSGRAAAVAVALGADRLMAEPPARWHPVALYGRAMQGVERRLYADRRSAGLVYAAAGIAGPAWVGWVVGRRSGPPRPRRRWLALAACTYLAVAGEALARAAAAVGGPLAAGDLAAARAALPALVGRDPSRLDRSEVARAVVESVAENTVDAVVAPALWALAGGPSGVLAYRAANTLDAMVGHRSERYLRFGWASARLDDAGGWLPARVTAALVAMVRPAAAGRVWRAVRDQAPAHPSPNSGVAEAAFAAALGVRLGGNNVYAGRLERRPALGDGRAATGDDIRRAVRLHRDVTAALALLCLAAHLRAGRGVRR